MATITSLMHLAQQALVADQAALNVTANNVANQTAPGYTRETVTLQAQDAVELNGTSYGSGVTASAPQSQRNRVLEQQVQQQMQVASHSATLTAALNQVQNVFGLSASPTSSSLTQLGTAVDGLFSALSALETDPSSTPTRQGVLSAASNLTGSFNSAAGQLSSIQSGLNNQVGTMVGQVNTLTQQIAGLNQKIATIGPNGDAGQLEDQRQLAIEQLSKLVGLDQITTSANGIDLTTTTGSVLVAGSNAYALSMAVVGGVAQVYVNTSSGAASTATTANTAGASSNLAAVALSSVAGGAVAGTHTVVVNSLATVATATSDVVTDPTAVLSGSLTIGGTTVPASAANGSNTLAGLARAINTASQSANLGVTASVVTNASGQYLALSADGSAGQTLLSGITNTLSYTTATNTTPTTLNVNPGQTGADASLTVDGAAVTSPTNTITAAIAGVSFVAVAAGTSQLAIQATLTGGQLGGTLQALYQEVPAAQSSLDSLAYAIGAAVNTQNSAGVDGNGNPGAALFALGTSAAGAASTVAAATANPSLVAAAGVGEGTSGSTNASALAALGTALLGNGQTADGSLSSLLAGIGQAASAATNDTTVQQATLTQLTTQRDTTSAVSLDTEAANLTMYQRSYQAAAQVFTTVNQIMASAINLGVETAVA
jgi:flagellar hook-associated protein 1